MAPRRSTPLEDPPLAFSSSEEEETDSEEEEEVPEKTGGEDDEEETNSEEEEEVPEKPGGEDDEEETNSEEEEEVPEKTGGGDDEEETNSEEEEEVPEKTGGGDDDEEETDSEEEEEVPEKVYEEGEDFVAVQKNARKLETENESEDENESESDSKLEMPKAVAKSNVKPISSKPTQNESETDSESVSDSKLETPKAFTKLNVTDHPKNKAKAVAAFPWKRGAEEDGNKEAKRSKKKEGDADVGEKSSNDAMKTPFQRLWSEEDEVVVLEGVINFVEKNGVDAIKSTASFHEFIKKDLHIDVSLSQLKDKIFRLKKKFENNRKGKMGEEKMFNKGHDQKIFDLSKRIWGSEASVAAFGDSAFKSNGKMKAAKEEANAGCGGSSLKVESLYFDGSSDYVMRKGAELMQGAKKCEMDEKVRQLHVEELKLFLKRNELVREYANVVLAAYDYKMDED